MLGRVRISSSNSLEELELERLPSKIIKDDSLSIYERTLMKLKQGSQYALCSPTEDTMNTDRSYASPSTPPNDEAITPEANCCSSPLSSNDSRSIYTSSEHHKMNVSVIYMFSRYKSSRHGGSSFAGASPSSCDCQQHKITRL